MRTRLINVRLQIATAREGLFDRENQYPSGLIHHPTKGAKHSGKAASRAREVLDGGVNELTNTLSRHLEGTLHGLRLLPFSIPLWTIAAVPGPTQRCQRWALVLCELSRFGTKAAMQRQTASGKSECLN
jgi:hypothetical protein